MKTEEIERKPRGLDPNEVSRALQELQPLSWELLDRRGRQVPLTSAGYVLRFGHAYHLRLVSPFRCEEIEHVRLDNPAPFLAVEPSVHEQDDQGRSVHILPFRVKLDLWSILRRLGMTVSGDELEVRHQFKPNVYRHAEPFLCPIVVRPRWATVLVAVLGGLLLMVVERLVSNLFAPASANQNLDDLFYAAEQRTTWWYFLAIAGAVWLLVNVVNLFLLYRRSRELRQNFRELYPVADTTG
jgi:hypothetical protein